MADATMTLYHTTSADAVPWILDAGFKDNSFLDGGRGGGHRGVWLADKPVPFDFEEAGEPVSAATLSATIPGSVVLPFEVKEHYPGESWRTWREFLVPARIANRYEWRVM